MSVSASRSTRERTVISNGRSSRPLAPPEPRPVMNVDRIEAVLRLLSRQGHIEELQVESESFRLSARRLPGLAPLGGEPDSGVESAPPRPLVITAPRVGIFRAGKQPVTKGAQITSGAVVGSIDSMRILNPITAE